jgi:tRNA pseudouridine32 synthase/23S rRNA pseudouridine746 synthase
MPINDHFIYAPPLETLDITFEDDDLVVIDKPAGLLSVMWRLPEHRDSAYLRILEKFPLAKVTHRLDMATSGILMFAKHRDAEVAMSKMFQARKVKKHYIALVQGHLADHGCIEAPLITDWPNRPRQKVDFEIGKPAKTLYQHLDYNKQEDHSRILLEPITGRSHQLRVHLMHIGHPITGDKLYHPKPTNSPLQRLALHASYLAFKHPTSSESLVLASKVSF